MSARCNRNSRLRGRKRDLTRALLPSSDPHLPCTIRACVAENSTLLGWGGGGGGLHQKFCNPCRSHPARIFGTWRWSALAGAGKVVEMWSDISSDAEGTRRRERKALHSLRVWAASISSAGDAMLKAASRNCRHWLTFCLACSRYVTCVTSLAPCL